MLMSYLLSALVIAVIATFLCLMTGGTLLMAFVVYSMSGLLMTATLATVVAFKRRAAQH